MGAIKEKMKRDMEIRGLSKRTKESYLGCVKQFVKYFMKSPDRLSLEDIHGICQGSCRLNLTNPHGSRDVLRKGVPEIPPCVFASTVGPPRSMLSY